MLNKLNYILSSLATVRFEAEIVTDALFQGKAKLPKNYWRFLLLQPLGITLESNSPLIRNFCPLFWITNVLLLAYVVLSPLFIVGYPTYLISRMLWRQVKKINNRIKKAQRTSNETNNFKRVQIESNLANVPKDIKSFSHMMGLWEAAEHDEKEWMTIDVVNSLYHNEKENMVEYIIEAHPEVTITDIKSSSLQELFKNYNKEYIDFLVASTPRISKWNQFLIKLHALWIHYGDNAAAEFVKLQQAYDKHQKEQKRKADNKLKNRVVKLLPLMTPYIKTASKWLIIATCIGLLGLLCVGIYNWAIPVSLFLYKQVLLCINFLLSIDFWSILIPLAVMSVVVLACFLIVNTVLLVISEKLINIFEWLTKSSALRGSGSSAFSVFESCIADAKNSNNTNKLKEIYGSIFMLLAHGVYRILHLSVTLILLPWLLVKMYAAENCPTIEIQNDASTEDTATSQSATE